MTRDQRPKTRDALRTWLDTLYTRYNHRQYVPPDPLQTLYAYDDLRDRELAALLAATLAYGNVKTIVTSVTNLLTRLGPSPRTFLEETPPADLAARIGPFRHRWTTTKEIANLLNATRQLTNHHGTLGEALRTKIHPTDPDIQPALTRWHTELTAAGLDPTNRLLAHPAKNSASKRTHLFLRWMIRTDNVDPGGWPIPPPLLIIPLDTHIHNIAHHLRLTTRRPPDLTTARQITTALRKICPHDPIKYDFPLTRLPLHENLRGPALARHLRTLR